jgi:ferredoxin
MLSRLRNESPVYRRKRQVLSMAADSVEVRLSGKAMRTLARAMKDGESISDVVVRLSEATLEGLQRRGEMDVLTSDGKDLLLSIDQEKCLGAMSCVSVAPSVFSYDDTRQGPWRRKAEPLGMKEVGEGEVSADTLRLAAESCPYRAIVMKDRSTGDLLFP